MTLYPTNLELVSVDRLRIAWSDGTARVYGVRDLRDACPCATCREKKKAPSAPAVLLPVITQQEAAPLRIAGMQPVGNYAYAIDFSDGHDTGIYSFEFLHGLGMPAT